MSCDELMKYTILRFVQYNYLSLRYTSLRVEILVSLKAKPMYKKKDLIVKTEKIRLKNNLGIAFGRIRQL